MAALDGFHRSHHRANVTVQDKPQLVQHFNIVGVVHGNHDRIAVGFNRDHQVLTGQRFRHQLDDAVRDLTTLQLDVVVAEFFSLSTPGIAARDVAQPNQGVLRSNPEIGRHAASFFKLRFADGTVVDKSLQPVTHSITPASAKSQYDHRPL